MNLKEQKYNFKKMIIKVLQFGNPALRIYGAIRVNKIMDH